MVELLIRHEDRERGIVNYINELFMLDTGATYSVAPLSMAEALLGREIRQGELQESPLKNVSGVKLWGVPLSVSIDFVSEGQQGHLDNVQETIWFCSNLTKKYGMLGQRSFFEQIGFVLLNDPQDTRYFGLFWLQSR